jgi:polysaccharide pyruvyl transferase WcaK-like protein
MKVAIFNDTSTAGHFGCDVVMDVLRQAVNLRGGEIIYCCPVGRNWRASRSAMEAIEAAAVVIVNGEGSIHHSQREAWSLAALGPYCAAAGKPGYLVNVSLEANHEAIMAELLAFRRIYVRDSASRAEIMAFGGEAGIVGDLSFGCALPPWSTTTGKPVVVDSVVKQNLPKLARMADRLEADFVSMKYTKGGAAFAKRRWFGGYSVKRRCPLAGISNSMEFAGYIGRHSYVITGRYHALCFAINMGVPVSIMRSNTGKSEALLLDAGLNPNRIIIESQPPEMQPYSDAEKTSMAAFLSATRAAREKMFNAIIAAD